jgi:putative methionine-R-sulfoxide reductase with GAF domain
MFGRDYRAVAEAVSAGLQPGAGLAERMELVVEQLWRALHGREVAWCGFYLPTADGRQLVLGPRRDRPACSPIGLHGVCGRAFRERRPVLVEDVSALGPHYVACDPRDRSEVVVPLPDARGSCRAVLDLDSHRTGAFDQSDVQGLGLVLGAAGLLPDTGG